MAYWRVDGYSSIIYSTWEPPHSLKTLQFVGEDIIRLTRHSAVKFITRFKSPSRLSS